MESLSVPQLLGIIIINKPIEVKAESYADKWLKKQQEQANEYMKELEKDENLTNQAIKSITKSDKEIDNMNKNKDSIGRSWVYGVDELHVIGLPTDERGYTKAGSYER